MSEEHKALGYRPPPGSLAAQAQAAVARHETQHAEEKSLTIEEEKLRKAALLDAERIQQEREAVASSAVDLNSVGEGECELSVTFVATTDMAKYSTAEARKLMSDEHKALGYRPPPGSLASEAQAAAAKHPDASAGVDTPTLARAALEDATHIASPNSKNLDVHNVGKGQSLLSD